MLKTIVFIDTNKSGSSREAIQAAEEMGYFTVVLTNQEGLMQKRTEFPDVHQMILTDFTYLEPIEEKLRKLESQGKSIEAIVSFVDPYVYPSTMLAERFKVNRISQEAIRMMEDKILTREALHRTSYCPHFATYEGDESINDFVLAHEDDLPLIVKSPKSCGSKDVLLAKTKSELKSTIKKLRQKYPGVPVLVEEYVDGPQYLVEVLVHDSTPHIVAVLEQEVEKNLRFIVTGYALLAEVPIELYGELENVVGEIVSEMRMTNGALHLELRYARNRWKLIEINPRISGGAMNKMIRTAFGINLVKETLKLQLGETPDLTRTTQNYVFTQHVTVSSAGYLERVTGKTRALGYPGVQTVYIKPKKNMILHPPTSMGHRYAYVLAAADSKDEARRIAKAAADEIKFHLSS